MLCLSVCVCLSVPTLAAASFISTIKLQYAGLQLSIFSSFSTRGFSKKCFVQTLWRHLLTVTVSDGIAATPVSLFPTEEGSDVVKRLTGR